MAIAEQGRLAKHELSRQDCMVTGYGRERAEQQDIESHEQYGKAISGSWRWG